MQYPSTDKATAVRQRWLGWMFTGTLVMATLTGFGQMPIFKRYYIADIPGLGWLAQFYVTHFLHYLFGTVLLAILGYLVAGWALGVYGRRRLTLIGKGKGLALAGILLTGVLLVLKNFSGYLYPPPLIVALSLIHLGLVMAWLVLALIGVVARTGWVTQHD